MVGEMPSCPSDVDVEGHARMLIGGVDDRKYTVAPCGVDVDDDVRCRWRCRG
jgi:hypothetical protein